MPSLQTIPPRRGPAPHGPRRPAPRLGARIERGIGLGLVFGLIAGCMTTVAVPPTFRFSCETDEDCAVRTIEREDGEDPAPEERCINGLCQYACTSSVLGQVDSDECPSEGNFYGCFNGTCAHTCDLEADQQCPAPQTCIGFDIPDELLEQFGDIPGGVDLSNTGICGIKCDDEGDCPEGQLCAEGTCIDLADLTNTGSDSSSGGPP